MKKERLIESMAASLKTTIEECLKHPELLEQYRRLHPRKEYLTAKKRQQAFEKEAKEFFDFIRDYIWLPVYLKNL